MSALIISHVQELAIVMKHLNAMSDELEKFSEPSGRKWGDGFFLSLGDITVTADGDNIVLGKIGEQEFGWDFVTDPA